MTEITLYGSSRPSISKKYLGLSILLGIAGFYLLMSTFLVATAGTHVSLITFIIGLTCFYAAWYFHNNEKYVGREVFVVDLGTNTILDAQREPLAKVNQISSLTHDKSTMTITFSDASQINFLFEEKRYKQLRQLMDSGEIQDLGRDKIPEYVKVSVVGLILFFFYVLELLFSF